MKPPSPLLTPQQQPLKPVAPLQLKNTPKTPISHPQRRRRFQSRLGRHPQRQQGFQTTAHLADRARLRSPWATAGIGQATSGRPMLQTSSNQRDSNHLARTPVTNVVNLSPKTAIFSEIAVGLTTFVTTHQKSTRKTPWIDDVCNNTHPSTPKTQHARPPMTPTGSRGTRLRCPWAVAGPGRASRRRAEPKARSADGSRAGRRPRAHKAAQPHSRARRRPEHPWDHKQHEKTGAATRVKGQNVCLARRVAGDLAFLNAD